MISAPRMGSAILPPPLERYTAAADENDITQPDCVAAFLAAGRSTPFAMTATPPPEGPPSGITLPLWVWGLMAMLASAMGGGVTRLLIHSGWLPP